MIVSCVNSLNDSYFFHAEEKVFELLYRLGIFRVRTRLHEMLFGVCYVLGSRKTFSMAINKPTRQQMRNENNNYKIMVRNIIKTRSTLL